MNCCICSETSIQVLNGKGFCEKHKRYATLYQNVINDANLARKGNAMTYLKCHSDNLDGQLDLFV